MLDGYTSGAQHAPTLAHLDYFCGSEWYNNSSTMFKGSVDSYQQKWKKTQPWWGVKARMKSLGDYGGA